MAENIATNAADTTNASAQAGKQMAMPSVQHTVEDKQADKPIAKHTAVQAKTQAASHSAEQADTQASTQPAKHSGMQMADLFAEHLAEQAVKQEAEHTAEQPAKQPEEQEQTAEQSANHIEQQPADQADNQGETRAVSQDAQQPAAQSEQQAAIQPGIQSEEPEALQTAKDKPSKTRKHVDYQAELNPEQYTAAITIQGPLRIIAGAGSGKTRTLVYRTAYMIENGISPSHILLLTFTNKAANEMKARLNKMLNDDNNKITACTFHSWCASVLRYYHNLFGVSDDFTIIDTTESSDALQRIKTELNFTKLKGFPNGKQIMGFISASVNTLQPLEDCIHNSGRMQAESYKTQIAMIAERYREYKQSHNFMDYDDLLKNVCDGLSASQDTRNILGSRYRYVMVDEYQDTNAIQERIVFLLTARFHNLCIVGDDYQSIYGWRGADVNNILDFAEKMPETKDVTLHRNYRSDQRILDFANATMKQHATMGIYKEMRSDYDFGMKPVLYRVDDGPAECDEVFDIIQKCKDDGFSYSDIAILERGGAYSYLVEAQLDQKKIPYVKYGGTKFIEREHIQDVIAYLKCIASPHNDLAFFRILKLYRGIGDFYAQQISDATSAHGYSGLTEKYKTNMFYKDMQDLHAHLLSWQNDSLEDMLPKIEKYYHHVKKIAIEAATKYKDEAYRDMALDKNDTNMVDFDTLNQLASEHKTLTGFLDDIALDATAPQDDTDCLTISTMHSAKGLEYPVIIILRCAQPDIMNKFATSEDREQEELRCYYVAITRAEKRLYMIAPSRVFFNGMNDDTHDVDAICDVDEYYDTIDLRTSQDERHSSSWYDDEDDEDEADFVKHVLSFNQHTYGSSNGRSRGHKDSDMLSYNERYASSSRNSHASSYNEHHENPYSNKHKRKTYSFSDGDSSQKHQPYGSNTNSNAQRKTQSGKDYKQTAGNHAAQASSSSNGLQYAKTAGKAQSKQDDTLSNNQPSNQEKNLQAQQNAKTDSKSNLKAGDRIHHDILGDGIITSRNNDELTVQFDNSNQTKILALSYAPIRKITESDDRTEHLNKKQIQ